MSDQSSPIRANADDVDISGFVKTAPKDAKRFREEYDQAKSKLVDQKFNPADYPDPLLPRNSIKLQYHRTFPAGTEERLKQLVASVESTKS